MCLALFRVFTCSISFNPSSNFVRWVMLLSLIYKWGNWDRGRSNNLLIPTASLVLIIIVITVSSTENLRSGARTYTQAAYLERTLLPLRLSLPTAVEQCNVSCSAVTVAFFQMIFLTCKKILFTMITRISSGKSQHFTYCLFQQYILYDHIQFRFTHTSTLCCRETCLSFNKWYASPF